MGNLMHTVSGGIASFRSAAHVPIESLKCHFKPKQDLHGYDYSWPAGGGKNLLPTTAVSTVTETGITFTVNSNGSIYVNGTATISTWLTIATITLKAGTYYVSGGIDAYSYINIPGIVNSYGASASFTLEEETTISPRIYITTGQTVNATCYPMIRLSSISNATWEPYENICPIEGWEGITRYRASKNVGHIVKYCSTTLKKPTNTGTISNSYGTTLSTMTFTLPDTALVITQEAPAQDYNTAIYKNGYFCVELDNLIYNNYYDISFKVTDIVSNPLNKTINNIVIAVPSGSRTGSPQVNGNILTYKNVKFSPHGNNPEQMDVTIYNNGMSFTLSEFMITPANANDGIWEPYCGEIIPITFPTTGKNKFFYDTSNYTLEQIITGSGTTVNRYVYHTALYGGTYTMSASIKDENNRPEGNYNLFNYGYMKNGQIYTIDNFIRTTTEYNRTITVTKDEEVVLIYTSDIAYSANRDIQKYNIQIECGDTATTYESYSTDHTYYGGYIDIVTGDVWQTIKYYTFNGEEQITDYSSGITGGKRLVSIVFDDCQSDVKYMYCNKAVVETSVQYQISHLGIRIGGGQGRFYFFVPDSMFDGEVTIDKFKQWLSENSLTATALLITPKLVGKLTPMELKTFLNYNNIWSNTNDITEVAYQIHDSNMIQQAKKNIMSENNTHYRKVLWNNMVNGYLSANDWKDRDANETSTTFENGVATINFYNSNGSYHTMVSKNSPNVYLSHKYYFYLEQKNDNNITICGAEYAGNRQKAVSGIALLDGWYKHSNISLGGRDGPGAMYTPFYYGKENIQGQNAQIRNILYIDLTAMFGLENEPKTPEEFEYLCKINNINLNEPHPQDTGTEQIWCIPNHNTNEYTNINWNQLAKPINSDNYQIHTAEAATLTFNDGVATRTILEETTNDDCFKTALRAKYTFTPTQGHIYYAKEELNSEVNVTYVMSYDKNWHVKTITPNQWSNIEDIFTWNSTVSNSKYIYICYRSGASAIGEVCSVRNPIFIDLTQMFGAGNEPATAAELRARCLKNNINLDNPQPYNTGTQMIWKL